MRVLVTGSHGYLGSVLVPVLLDAGHAVTGVDTLYYRGCDFGEPAVHAPTIATDVRDGPELSGFDAVIHLAALSNDPLGNLEPRLTYAINRDAAVGLARSAKRAGVRRFLFASSCAMYGARADGEALTEASAFAPLTPYAASKVDGDSAVRALADEGFAPVAMRFATAYGVSPRLRLDIVLNNLVGWAHTTGQIRLASDGTAWRPLLHVQDIARAALAILEAPDEVVRGQAFNIGSAEQNYRIRDLADVVQARLPRCGVTFADGASTDPRSYRVDFSKFAETFPWFAFEWSAERGVDELARAYGELGLVADDMEGDRFIRLNRLERLLAEGRVDGELRWAKPALSAAPARPLRRRSAPSAPR